MGKPNRAYVPELCCASQGPGPGFQFLAVSPNNSQFEGEWIGVLLNNASSVFTGKQQKQGG